MDGRFDLACTITGAGGFVGSALVNALLNQTDYSVRIFAIDKTQGRLPAPYMICDEVSSAPTRLMTFHEWDVTQPLSSNFLAVDTIYHFAGIANPEIYLKDPITVMDLNLIGLKNILERIVLWSDHRPRIVYSSTSEVYGLNTDVPFREDSLHYFSDARRWCYALTKLVGEQYLRAYAEEGVKHTIFRFFNFVGPDIDSPGMGRVLTKMVSSAIKHGEILVTEPGTQTRCFTHQDDFVVPLVRAMIYKRSDALYNTDNWTMNLGSDEEISMQELAAKISGILAAGTTDEPAKLRMVARDEFYGEGYDDCMRRRPDISEAKRVLNWSPTLRLAEFLPDLVREIARRHNA